MVAPIKIGKYVYSIPHFTEHNSGGVLREEDIETHTVSDYILYQEYKNPFLESDVQDVFFKSMEYLEKEHALQLIDEKKRIYMFDLKAKRLKGFQRVIQKYSSVIVYFCIILIAVYVIKKKRHIKT